MSRESGKVISSSLANTGRKGDGVKGVKTLRSGRDAEVGESDASDDDFKPTNCSINHACKRNSMSALDDTVVPYHTSIQVTKSRNIAKGNGQVIFVHRSLVEIAHFKVRLLPEKLLPGRRILPANTGEKHRMVNIGKLVLTDFVYNSDKHALNSGLWAH